MSPGGDKQAVDEVLPLLEKFSAKDPKSGKPCTANIGPRGSGHFVKMAHNGEDRQSKDQACTNKCQASSRACSQSSAKPGPPSTNPDADER